MVILKLFSALELGGRILLGLVGLGILVFVHELGHFLVARLAGIRVTAFSLGWGPPLLHKTVKGTDYRLSVFPVGGYCKMEGEGEFQKAWEDHKQGIKQERGTFYGESAPRRIAAVAAGPVFNMLFAALVFSVLAGAGSEYRSSPGRIVLARDITGNSYPADRAGLQTGDFITAINGKKTENYHDIQEAIALNAKKPMRFTVMRGAAAGGGLAGDVAAAASGGAAGGGLTGGAAAASGGSPAASGGSPAAGGGEILHFVIEPELEKDTGAGRIGVFSWNEPVIGGLDPGGAAARAGLLPGDRILEWDGQPFPYTAALSKISPEGAEMPETIPVVYERAGERGETLLAFLPEEEAARAARVGITWESVVYKVPSAGFPGSIAKGAERALVTFASSARSLTLLFRGVDVTKAVSGPVRISYMVGDVAALGFARDSRAGIRFFFEFLAFISVALALMNLLPLPILDGGLLIVFLVETLLCRPVHPKLFVVFQTAGVIIIGGIMLLSVYTDIMFFVRK